MPAVHVSAVAGHWKQPPPAVPHCWALAVAHVPPVQHPFGQVSARQVGQVPAVHAPGVQSSHDAPPEPQSMSSSPVLQFAPSQHPLQCVPSQMHTPPEQ
jgi:hypothetical protein